MESLIILDSTVGERSVDAKNFELGDHYKFYYSASLSQSNLFIGTVVEAQECAHKRFSLLPNTAEQQQPFFLQPNPYLA
jgi:aminopeptidase C